MRFERCHKEERAPAGFTLVEIAVTLLLLGMLFALAVPTVQQLSGGYHLRGTSENLAGQLRLARERAIATGKNQHFHFTAISGGDYYIVDHSTGQVPNRWKFPKGISYYVGAGSLGWIDMATDGRAKWGTAPASGFVILQDTRGIRDTVSIQSSGLIQTQ